MASRAADFSRGAWFEQPDGDGREEPELAQEPELFDQRACRVSNDRGLRDDDREALLRQFAEELQVELRFGASTDAFEEREHDASGVGGRSCTSGSLVRPRS